MTAQRHDVAIIGGGASGSLLAAQLVRQAPSMRVALIGKTGHGRGLAYSARSASHVLNVPAGRMSALPDEPEHFVRWCRSRGIELTGGDFVSRSLYGDYITDLVHQAADIADGRLMLMRDVATDVQPVDAGMRVTLSRQGGEIEASRVVLALGNAEPSVPRGLEGVSSSPAYVNNPWSDGAINVAGLSPDAEVLLVGTGLTMVDIAVELAARGHRGVMHAVSRRGLVPQAHRHLDGPPPQYPPPSTTYWPRSARGLLRAVRMYVRRCAVAGADWREAVTALRPVTSSLWSGLPLEEQRRFIARLQPYWDTHRHRAAPSVAHRIDDLRASGQLRVHAGRIEHATLDADRACVTIRPRGTTEQVAIRPARIVNCTGPRTDLRGMDSPLVSSMVGAGLISPDALRLGIACEPDGRVISSAPVASGLLWCIGPMRRAQLWETTAIPEIRAQARDLATGLAALSPATEQATPVVMTLGMQRVR
jgi:uncharacterized NAD(P)/FAD-binding protein YdhS